MDSTINHNYMDTSKITVNIIGCCVSRNLFNVKKGVDYEIKGHVQRSCLLNILDKCDDEYRVDFSHIQSYCGHNFDARNLMFLMNGGADNFLLERKGDWLVIDSFYCFSRLGMITYCDGTYRIINSDITHLVKKVVDSHPSYKGCKFQYIHACQNYSIIADVICDFIRKNWGNNVIFINVPPANLYISTTGIIRKRDIMDISVLDSAIQFQKIMLSKLKCHVIDIPMYVLGDMNNGYQSSPVHYVSEIYDYLKQCVDLITAGDDTCLENSLLINRLTLEHNLLNIIEYERLSVKNTIVRIENIMKTSNYSMYPDAIELCEQLMEENHPEGFIALGDLYLKGGGVIGRPNVNKSFQLYLEAVKIEKKYTNSIVDRLYRMNNDVSGFILPVSWQSEQNRFAYR